MASDDSAPPITAATPAGAGVSPPGKPGPPYLKLPGRASTLGGGVSGVKKLYLGADHLLQVDTVFFTEKYRRFAYTDIQSLLLRRNARGLIINLLLGLPVVLFGVFGWSADDEASRGMLWGTSGFFALLLIINVARGATCHCQLETAIGVQPLPSLGRVRPAQKAFALLAQRIAGAQGRLSTDDASQGIDALLNQGPRAGETLSSTPRQDPY